MRKTYVFDMDGTLINSVDYVIEGTAKVAYRHGIEYNDDIVRLLTPLGYLKSAEYLIKEYSLNTTVEALYDEYMAEILPYYEKVIKMDAAVEDYLRRLSKEGARIFLFTASPRLLVEANLKRNGIIDLFERIYTVDEFGLTKGNPEVYRILADDIGTPPCEIEYFDDSPVALRNAKSVGYITRAVYEKKNSLPIEDMRSEFDEFIMDLSEYARAH